MMSENILADRLLAGADGAREIAIDLYTNIKDYPIISPHGHVDPRTILENKAFSDPADLFIYNDHYITRQLHSIGFPLEKLGKDKNNSDPRGAWKILCSNWHIFAGTASGYWFQHQLATLFGINVIPSESNADEIYDQIKNILQSEALLPQNILRQNKIQFLATTDDPCDDLSVHAAITEDSSITCRVVPTFRPDKYLDPRISGWVGFVQQLLNLCDKKEVNYKNYISALEERRAYFVQHGAVSTDHGVFEPFTCQLDEAEAIRLFESAIKGAISLADARLFAGHMLTEMARMSTNDGLVMTLHAGVLRNHSSDTYKKFGSDTGHDIPVKVEFTENLKPLLEKYGLNSRLHLILFCLDEVAVTREVAPLASFYPSVFIGAPWWFLDSPSGIRRFRESVTDIAGFYKGSGFIDDTRAFLSIQARHDMARRVDCSYLADLVVNGRIDIDTAKRIAKDLVTTIPMNAFKL